MVGWWSCRIKLARSQEIGSICMCYAMRIHKSPIACKGKKSRGEFLPDAAVFCEGSEEVAVPGLFFHKMWEMYISVYIYFLHLPLLFFRTEIIVMTISVFYKKRTRKLPNTNWGRLRILFLLLYKGFWQFDSFFFSFLFWERGEENRGEGIRCRVH